MSWKKASLESWVDFCLSFTGAPPQAVPRAPGSQIKKSKLRKILIAFCLKEVKNPT